MLFAVPAAAAQREDRLLARQVGVIVNDEDALSRRIGAYAAEKRGIPEENLIHVSFAPGRPDLPVAEFEGIEKKVRELTPPGVQAYALTWAMPYRVHCMSITSAFAFGFDAKFCSRETCATTQSNPMFDYRTHRPWDDLHMRPAMALAATDFEHAKALIDRGLAADGAYPRGTAYLVITNDRARMTRLSEYSQAVDVVHRRLRVEVIRGDFIENRSDVMFYFTGAISVPKIETLRFLPGAVADHLTSSGGELGVSSQMSALRWLEAGATGSYGTVVEPCSYPQKFPNIPVFLSHYLDGDALIEAYWRSVAWPGEGVFIGDPLATPYRPAAPRSHRRRGGAR